MPMPRRWWSGFAGRWWCVEFTLENAMELLLIRHGRKAGDAYLRPAQPVQGFLSEDAGLPQARALAEALRDVRVDVAFSSPFGRALQTAELALAGRGVPIQAREYLQEWEPTLAMRTGSAEQVAELMARDRERYAERTWKTELGEGCFEFYGRVIPPFLDDLAALGIHARMGGFMLDPGARELGVAVFAHGGSLAVLLAHLLGLPPFPLARFEFLETGVARLRFTGRRDIFHPVLVLPAPHATPASGWV